MGEQKDLLLRMTATGESMDETPALKTFASGNNYGFSRVVDKKIKGLCEFVGLKLDSSASEGQAMVDGRRRYLPN